MVHGNGTKASAVRVMALVAVLLGLTAGPARAQAQQPGSGGFRFGLGFTAPSGMSHFTDRVFDAALSDLEADGFVFDDPDPRFTWPIGLTLHPYYEFRFGLGVGGSVGPFILGYISVVGSGGFFGDSFERNDTFFIVPAGPDVRYTLLRGTNASPYVRAGFRYPIVAGDIVGNGRAGSFAAVGVELFRRKAVQLGLEVGYDAWEVEVTGGTVHEVVRPGQRLVTVSVLW